jgi:uncharacterized protein
VGALIGVAAIVAAGAALQSVSGFGYALVVSPVLAVLLGPKTSVVVMTLLGVPMTAANALRWRKDLLGREAFVVCLASLVGLPIGAWVLTTADERTLRLVVGAVVLALTAWLWRGLVLPPGRRTEIAAGVASGALAASTGTNGPPLVIAFQAVGMEPPAFRATLASTFMVQGSLALVSFWIGGLVTAALWPYVLAGAPALVAGTLIGDRLALRIDLARFRSVVLLTLAASGAVAVASALLG